MSKGLAFRFNKYQTERFPFAVLIFTTFSVVLSSAAVVLGKDASLQGMWLPIIVGTITCLLFMFNIRVFDDFKDKGFDDQFYKERPVQRGLISLKELNTMNIVSLVVQVILNLTASLYAFLYWLLALIYSLLARAEFFMKSYIRKRFILYNALNLLQLFFLQIYLYALIQPGFSFRDPLIFIHFLFVLTNAIILEVARKLKSKEDESRGKDTYSGRYGVGKASLIYAGSFLATYLLFLVIFVGIAWSTMIFVLSVLSLILIVGSTYYYFHNHSKLSSQIVQGTAILYYLSMHLLVAGAALI